MLNKTELILTKSVSKLLYNQSIPAIVGMLVLALYNVVDTIFVGHGVGTDAVAGISIVMPIQMLVFSISIAIGIGGSSIISRCLGKKDFKKSDNTFGNMITLTVLSGIISLVLIQLFGVQLIGFFGATKEVSALAVEYLDVLSYGFVFVAILAVANNAIRSEGNAKEAMKIMLMSAIINIILDPIFIFYLNLGVAGAAWATVISQFSTLIYLLFFLKTSKTHFTLNLSNFRLKKVIVKEMLEIGASGFARQSVSSVINAIINWLLIFYGTTVSVAAFGIVFRIVMFGIMPVLGINQGMMPIIGQNFGAKLFLRVNEAFKKAVIYGTVFGTILYLLIFIFSDGIINIFTTDKDLILEGSKVLKIIMLMFPIIPFQIMVSGYYQALGKAKMSLFFALFRQVILLGPLILILPHYYGVEGIWMSFPIADLFAGVITVKIIYEELKKLKTSN